MEAFASHIILLSSPTKSVKPFISFLSSYLHRTPRGRAARSEINDPFRSTVLVVCLRARGQPYVRKPSNVLLMFNPFVGKSAASPISPYAKKSHSLTVFPPLIL